MTLQHTLPRHDFNLPQFFVLCDPMPPKEYLVLFSWFFFESSFHINDLFYIVSLICLKYFVIPNLYLFFFFVVFTFFFFSLFWYLWLYFAHSLYLVSVTKMCNLQVGYAYLQFTVIIVVHTCLLLHNPLSLPDHTIQGDMTLLYHELICLLEILVHNLYLIAHLIISLK